MRIHAIDNAKFLMVFLVGFGHLIEPIIGTSPALKAVYLSIYSFHMPVFALLAGMTSSATASMNGWHKIARTILVPFLLFNLLYEIFHFFIDGVMSSYARNLQPYWIMWFLYSLVIWRLILPIVLKARFPIALSLCCAIAVGYVDFLGYLPGISRTIYFMPFFLLGHRLAPVFFESAIAKGVSRLLLASVLLLNLMFFWWVSDLSPQWLYGSSSYASIGREDYLAGIVRAGLYAISFVTSMSVLILMPNTQKAFTGLGRNSLPIYLWHGFVVKALIAAGVVVWIGTGEFYFQLLSLAVVALLIAVGFGSRYVAVLTDKMLLRSDHARPTGKY